MRQLSPLIAREAVRPAAATSSPTCRNIVADVLLATQMASASAASAASPTAALLRELCASPPADPGAAAV